MRPSDRTITLRELVDSQAQLRQLSTKNLPSNVAYRLGRIGDMAEREMKQFQQMHIRLVRKFGTCVDVQTDKWEVLTVNAVAFNDAIAALMAERIPFPYDPFQLKDFGNVALSGEEARALKYMIVDPVEDKALDELEKGRTAREALLAKREAEHVSWQAEQAVIRKVELAKAGKADATNTVPGPAVPEAQAVAMITSGKSEVAAPDPTPSQDMPIAPPVDTPVNNESIGGPSPLMPSP